MLRDEFREYVDLEMEDNCSVELGKDFYTCVGPSSSEGDLSKELACCNRKGQGL